MAFSWHNHNGTVHKTSHLMYIGHHQKVCTCQQLTKCSYQTFMLFIPSKKKALVCVCKLLVFKCGHYIGIFIYFIVIWIHIVIWITNLHAITDPGEDTSEKKLLEWREMLNDPMTNMLFLFSNITFLPDNTEKWLIAICLSSVPQYLNPFKTHTWFSSIFQTLVEIQRNVILYEWAQSKLS